MFSVAFKMNAQELKKYDGRYFNGLSQAGDATYTYYYDLKTNKEIKQGKFRYSFKVKDSDRRIYQNFFGQYEKDLKNGNWSYKTTYRDLAKEDEAKRYLTGAVSLEAAYKNGWPTSKWVYKSDLKQRQRKYKGSSYDWTKFTPVNKIFITLNFKKGVLIDSVDVNSNDLKIEGILDANGFFNGKWIIKNSGIETISEYDHGFEKSIIKKNMKTGEIIEKLNFKKDYKKFLNYRKLQKENPSKLKHLSYKLDTSSVLNNMNNELTKLMKNCIYNDSYFLYRFVQGDLCFFYDENNYKYYFKTKGAFTIKMKNQISTEQFDILKEISDINSRMKTYKRRVIKYKKEVKLSSSSESMIKLMIKNTTIFNKYSCLIMSFKDFYDIEKGILQANELCQYKGKLAKEIPKLSTKDEYMNYFIKEIRKLKKETEAYYKLVKKERDSLRK